MVAVVILPTSHNETFSNVYRRRALYSNFLLRKVISYISLSYRQTRARSVHLYMSQQYNNNQEGKKLLLLTCSAVFNKFSISKLLVRDVCLFPNDIMCGSADEDGAGELSTSGEYIMSLAEVILCKIQKIDFDFRKEIKNRNQKHDSMSGLSCVWSTQHFLLCVRTFFYLTQGRIENHGDRSREEEKKIGGTLIF